jgi:hypothetical protein
MRLRLDRILLVFLSSVCLSACFDGGTSSEANDAAISDASTDAADTTVDDVSADAADAEPDTEQDAGPCQGACSGDYPQCEPTSGECVACLDDTHCIDGLCAADNTCVQCFGDDDCSFDPAAPACNTDTGRCVACMTDDECATEISANVCNTDTNECAQCLTDDDCAEGGCAPDNTCVECTTDDHCTDPTASVCDTNTYECTDCTDDDGCSHLDDTLLCDTSGDDGVCIECTVDDESACNGNSCDPATNTCTQTPTDQTETCMPCKADSECVADHRCVQMEFDGTQLADGYCLKIATTGCGRPYTGLIERESISGASSETYCGVDESVTTCQAVLDLLGDKSCSSDSDCGLPQQNDGRCESVNFVPDRCTYSCSADADCVSGRSCGSLPADSDYCGGGGA